MRRRQRGSSKLALELNTKKEKKALLLLLLFISSLEYEISCIIIIVEIVHHTAEIEKYRTRKMWTANVHLQIFNMKIDSRIKMKLVPCVCHNFRPNMSRRDIRTGLRWSIDEECFLREQMTRDLPPSFEDIARTLGREELQVRNRWSYIIEPGFKKGLFSPEEDQIIMECIKEGGGAPQWSKIAMKVPGRLSKQCRDR